MIQAQFQEFFVKRDRASIPKWSEKVRRWYQLDGASYALAEVAESLFENCGRMPEFLFISAPLASNTTDFNFVQSDPMSAKLFVHTLPNIRGSAFSEVMSLECPMLCVSDGEGSFKRACEEALEVIETDVETAWVVEVRDEFDENEPMRVKFAVITRVDEGLIPGIKSWNVTSSGDNLTFPWTKN